MKQKKEDTTMEINLATYAVRDASGVVDTNATVTKFSSDLDNFIAARETEQETIAAAVNGVFDSHKGVRMNVPFVISQALVALNVAAHPYMYNTLSQRVHAFISDNSKGDNSLFVIAKGKNGGCSRRADLAPATTDSK